MKKSKRRAFDIKKLKRAGYSKKAIGECICKSKPKVDKQENVPESLMATEETVIKAMDFIEEQQQKPEKTSLLYRIKEWIKRVIMRKYYGRLHK